MTKQPDPIVDAFSKVEFEDDKPKQDDRELVVTPASTKVISQKTTTPKRSFNVAAREHSHELAELVIRKQRDYGPGNIMNSVVSPELAIAVRLNDKLARLVNLVKNGTAPENETLQDTADDIMGYGLVLKMVLSGDFTLPLE